MVSNEFDLLNSHETSNSVDLEEETRELQELLA